MPAKSKRKPGTKAGTRKRAAAKRPAASRATRTPIDEYLARVRDDQRPVLDRLRATIRAAAPDAEEYIGYQLAAFRHNGPLVAFGASASHCAFYPMSGTTVEAFKKELEGYETSKGTIRFRPDKPLPAALVRKLVKVRLDENLRRAGRK